MSTRGDEILDRSLAKIGGKGLFVKELENALEDGRADIAVHSAKDVPMDLPAGFTLAAFLAREDPRDALVSNRYERLADLPAGRGRRHLQPAARGAAAQPLSRARHPAAARQSRHAARQARPRRVRRDRAGRRGAQASRARRPDSRGARAGGKPARGGAGRARDRVPRRPAGARGGARAAARRCDGRLRARRACREPRARRELHRPARGARGADERRARTARARRESGRQADCARRSRAAMRPRRNVSAKRSHARCAHRAPTRSSLSSDDAPAVSPAAASWSRGRPGRTRASPR